VWKFGVWGVRCITDHAVVSNRAFICTTGQSPSAMGKAEACNG
jgi:hypothetical protein